MPLGAACEGHQTLAMKTFDKRSWHAVLCAGLASAGLACASQKPDAGAPVDLLIARSKDSNAALLRGDIERYKQLVAIGADFTLFSPFGGEPTRGAPTPEGMTRMGKFFRDGTLEQEVVQAYQVADMVVLAVIERARVAVGGLPLQDWALRVTLVYRRDRGEWRLVHRHADPLVESISLQHSAALARGIRPEEERPAR
jgi:ketosteroid isomerase-like protein